MNLSNLDVSEKGGAYTACLNMQLCLVMEEKIFMCTGKMALCYLKETVQSHPGVLVALMLLPNLDQLVTLLQEQNLFSLNLTR